MNKGETTIQMMKAVKVTKKTGMETLCSFILGYPEETRSDLWRTIHFAKKIGIDFAEFSIATPYPGTELFEFATKEELFLTKYWSQYSAGKPVINPKYYSVDELNCLFVKAYRSFYLSPSVLIHHIRKDRIGFFIKVIKNLIPKFLLSHERLSKNDSEKLKAFNPTVMETKDVSFQHLP